MPGVLGAGVLSGFRALLSGVVPQRLLHSAVSVNAMVVDVVITAGPVLLGGLALLSGSAPLLAMAAAPLLAVMATGGARGSRPELRFCARRRGFPRQVVRGRRPT